MNFSVHFQQSVDSQKSTCYKKSYRKWPKCWKFQYNFWHFRSIKWPIWPNLSKMPLQNVKNIAEFLTFLSIFEIFGIMTVDFWHKPSIFEIFGIISQNFILGNQGKFTSIVLTVKSRTMSKYRESRKAENFSTNAWP